MRGLLDTHTLLWWLDGDERLSSPAREFIGDESNGILVSAASAWEIAIKVRLGKLPGAVEVTAHLAACLHQQGFTPLVIRLDHALRAGSLPDIHRDPFDRMLIAQAQVENLLLLSNEAVFDDYGISRLW